MTNSSAKKKTKLIISLKKKRLFQENSDSITNIHDGIAMNERISRLRRETGKEQPEEHKKIMQAIHEVEQKEHEIREKFEKLGIPKEEQPPESRTLNRLNIEEKLKNGDEAAHWGTSVHNTQSGEAPVPKNKLH